LLIIFKVLIKLFWWSKLLSYIQ